MASSVRGETESNFDITVAADGSGNFTKISEAVAAAPAHSDRRYYIKIKAGTYVENVIVGTDKTNLVFIGDDMDKTIITSNRSNKTGYGTIDTATVGKFLHILSYVTCMLLCKNNDVQLAYGSSQLLLLSDNRSINYVSMINICFSFCFGYFIRNKKVVVAFSI